MTDTTKPGRAEAALQAVAVAERLLHVAQLPVGGRQALDGGDLGAVGLHGEHQAGAHRVAVEQHRARPAHAVLAAEVGAGEGEVLAEDVGQGLAGLDDIRRGAPFTVSATVTGSAMSCSSWASATARCHASATIATPTRRR